MHPRDAACLSVGSISSDLSERCAVFTVGELTDRDDGICLDEVALSDAFGRTGRDAFASLATLGV